MGFYELGGCGPFGVVRVFGFKCAYLGTRPSPIAGGNSAPQKSKPRNRMKRCKSNQVPTQSWGGGEQIKTPNHDEGGGGVVLKTKSRTYVRVCGERGKTSNGVSEGGLQKGGLKGDYGSCQWHTDGYLVEYVRTAPKGKN